MWFIFYPVRLFASTSFHIASYTTHGWVDTSMTNNHFITVAYLKSVCLCHSNYWRGLLDEVEQSDPITSSAVSSSTTGSAITPLTAPLLGISLSESAAASVAEHLDGGVVKAPRLNYAFLSLGQAKTGKKSLARLLSAHITIND
jgi:hypothetical protein